MGVRVAELYVEMETRGNLLRDMTEAERRLGQIDAGARTAGASLDRHIGQGATQAARGIDRVQQSARTMSNSISRIDATAITAITRNASNAGEELRRLNRWQLDDLIREANRAGSQLGQQIPQGASQAERSLRRLDAAGLERLIQNAREARREIGNIPADAPTEEEGAASGGGFLAGFMDKIKGLGGKGGPIAGALVGVAAIGLGAGALLMKGIQDGMQQEVDRDKIQASMGIDDATMGKIARASADAYTNVFGESINENMQAAQKAMESGLLGRDATQQEIQKTIEGLSTIASITGEEIPAASRAAGQLIKTGLAKNSQEAFDIIVKGQQAGLNVSEDWLDTISEYSTKWRDLGLSAEDAMALTSQMVKQGARDTDVAADALKEFSIRAKDGSETSATAFETLGLNAQEMTDKFNQGGDAARGALQEVLTKMQALEDPTKKTAVAVGLFGTQAEDLGGALNNLDLEKARQELGQTAGVAENAMKTMGDNAATSLEGARRSIEVSMNGVSNSLAQAFGPTLEKVANWVKTHQPEITGFFVAVADACLATGQAIASFVSGTLRYFAIMSKASANFFGPFLKQLGTMSSALGGVLKHIPGMEATGKSLQTAGDAMKDYQGSMSDASGTLNDWADKVDAGNEALGRTRESLKVTGAETVATQEVFRALGDQVTSVPDDKTIKVTDNSPEAQARFAELGIKIEAIPGTKDFKLVANTAEGQTRIDSFIKTNTGKTIPITARVSFVDIQGNTTNNPALQTTKVPGGRYADGGIVDRQAQVTDKPILWGEAGPEAYIPLDESKRKRSSALLADVAQRFGMKLTRMAEGGITDESSSRSSKQQNVDTIIRVGREMEMPDQDIIAAISTGLVESNLVDLPDIPDSEYDSAGVFQQRPSMGWGPAGQGVAQDTRDFFNAYKNTDPSMTPGQRAQATQRSAYPDRYAERMAEAEGLFRESSLSNGGSGSDLTGGAGAGTGSPQTDGGGGYATDGTVTSDDGTRVFVTNWPGDTSSNAGDVAGRKPAARLGLAFFAAGGTVGGMGTSDTEPAMLTPGEEVIKRGPAQQFRSLLKAINAGHFAGGGTVGGFGGGYDSSPDPSHKLGLMDMAGLAAGLGFTAVSGFSSTGKFQGFNTSNTNIPGLDEALKALAEKIQPQPAVVVEHAEVNANNPQEFISSLSGINPALTQIVQRGLL